jgi:uncharacterized protein YwgA
MQPKLTALHRVLNALGVAPEIETVDDRKRVQKAIYLGQVAGVDLGYRFGWYKLGPYSPKLTRDYYALAEALEIGERLSGPRLAAIDAKTLKKLRGLFQPPAEVTLPSESWLELLASLDYLKRVSKLDDAAANEVIKDQKPVLHPFIRDARRVLHDYAVG